MIIFDLDGTLADIEHRRGMLEGLTRETAQQVWTKFFKACVHDAPNRPIIDVFHAMRNRPGVDVEIWSGRSDIVREETQAWITEHLFNGNSLWLMPSHRLWHVPLRMRPANDHRSDVVLKEFWLKDAISKGKRIDMVFDDRRKVVDMWRANGITCLQVAEGDF